MVFPTFFLAYMYSVYMANLEDVYIEKKPFTFAKSAFYGYFEKSSTDDPEVILLDIAETLQILYYRDTMAHRAAIDLYKIVDPAATVTKTGIKVAESDIPIIKQTLGNQYESSSDAVKNIKEDIDVVLKYNNLCKKQRKASQDHSWLPQPVPVETIISELPPAFPSKTIDARDAARAYYMDDLKVCTDPIMEQCGPEIKSYERGPTSFGQADYKCIEESTLKLSPHSLTVIWCGVTNMSLIYEACNTGYVQAQQICAVCPTFIIVTEISLRPDEHEIAVKLFHKKVFKSVDDLTKRLKSYKDLYLEDTPVGKHSERELVQMILDTHFVVSTNPAMKMQSSELINLICSMLPDECGGFRNRIPGYLLESGLSKKRLSTGNYYYGIRPTVSTDIKLSKATTLEALELQRDRQMQSIKPIPRTVQLVYDNTCDKPPTLVSTGGFS